MKVPENFSASATKKVNPLEAAIAGNFENAGREEKSQISNAVTVKAAVSTTETPASQSSNEISTEETKKTTRREVKEKFLVSMSKGERSIFKSFCALQGVSMNHFVMCAMDYFKEDLENGKVSLSSHSYKRKES